MSRESAEFALPDASTAISMGEDDKEGKTGISALNMDSEDTFEERDEATGDDDPENGDTGVDEDDGEDAGESDTGLSEEDLGAFDPEDEEQVARFDTAFTAEDGSLDIEGALSKHYWQNVEAEKEGFSEGIYQYLEAKGIKRSTVKQFEAMAQTQKDADTKSVTAHDGALFEVAGGPDELSKALAWGKGGGYSKEQQARFNKLTGGKDLEAKKEAVEVLMARYKKANPPKRPSIPGRDATKGGGGRANGALPFKDRHEMKQMRDALRENDGAGWALFRKRRNASSF